MIPELPEPRIDGAWATRAPVPPFALEITLMVACYLAYAIGRGLIYDDNMLPAFVHALDIVNLERSIGVFFEASAQGWLLDNASPLVWFSNWFYVLGYWPVILPLTALLYVRDRQAYKKHRTVALITLGATLVIYEVYPLAPPRMLPALGFVDTLVGFGLDEYAIANDALRFNPYAAIPSLHFGLPLVVCLAFLRSRYVVVKLLLWGYLALMYTAVVVTANHYIVDPLAAAGLVGLGFLIRKYCILFVNRTGLINLTKPQRTARAS